MNLNIMCGIPGSGKSTFIENNKGKNDIVVSRDQIRFNILKPGEAYFKHEEEVFKKFVNAINVFIRTNRYENIWVDATHLTQGSRSRLYNSLDKKLREIPTINYYVFDVPLDVAIDRNRTREGLKNVPEDTIENMYDNFKSPNPTFEKYIDNVYWVDENGEIKND